MSTLSQPKYLEIIEGTLYKPDIYTPVELKEYVSQETKIPVETLEGRRRPSDIVLARQIGMFGLRHRFQMPLKEVGNQFGGRDHGTVSHGLKTIESYLQCAGKDGISLYNKILSYQPPQVLDNKHQIPHDFGEYHPNLAHVLQGYKPEDIAAVIDAVYRDEDLRKMTFDVPENQLSLELKLSSE